MFWEAVLFTQVLHAECLFNNLQLAFGLFAELALSGVFCFFFYFMLYVVINCASLRSPFLVNVLLSLLRSGLTGGTSGSRMTCTSRTSHAPPGFAFQFAPSKAGKERRR